MNIQRLRNLTTKRIHTNSKHIPEDIAYLTKLDQPSSHQIPNAYNAILPWLREKTPDPRLWNGKYDPAHTGDIDLQPMTSSEQAGFIIRYLTMSDIFASLGRDPKRNIYVAKDNQ